MTSKLSSVIAITTTIHTMYVDHCLSIHYKYIYKRLAFISKATSRYVYPQKEQFGISHANEYL